MKMLLGKKIVFLLMLQLCVQPLQAVVTFQDARQKGFFLQYPIAGGLKTTYCESGESIAIPHEEFVHGFSIGSGGRWVEVSQEFVQEGVIFMVSMTVSGILNVLHTQEESDDSSDSSSSDDDNSDGEFNGGGDGMLMFSY